MASKAARRMLGKSTKSVGPESHCRIFGVSAGAVKRNRMPVRNRMSQPALAPYQATGSQKATITSQTTQPRMTLLQAGLLPRRPPVNARSITARLLQKKAGAPARAMVREHASSWVHTSPARASRHAEYSSHNATLSAPLGPAPLRASSVA